MVKLARGWGAFLVTFVLWSGCRELRDIQHHHAEPPPLQALPRTPEAQIGMNGYQPGLYIGRTGDGRLGTAGLRARGGGPEDAMSKQVLPYGLAPDQHIGTGSRVRSIRVITDPAWKSVGVYAR
jgi:hypothetical protein